MSYLKIIINISKFCEKKKGERYEKKIYNNCSIGVGGDGITHRMYEQYSSVKCRRE